MQIHIQTLINFQLFTNHQIKIVKNNPKITLITIDYEFLYLIEPVSNNANPIYVIMIINPEINTHSKSFFYGVGIRLAA